MSKLNLLRETTAELAAHGLTPASVKWVGSSDGRYACSWKRFTEIADLDYDQGYGVGALILSSVASVGKDNDAVAIVTKHPILVNFSPVDVV